jgi:hypothetical protein
MATIANDTQFIGISPTIDLTGKKSAILNEQTIPVTMDDITSTVRPYKVFTALLTQSKGDIYQTLSGGAGQDELNIGTTYIITGGSPNCDFTNVGAPNNNTDTSFIATGTTPNSWGDEVGITDVVGYNAGAPVATVLENTIGNIWFSYIGEGVYGVISNLLFTENKTSIALGNVTWDGGSNILKSGFDGESDGYIITALTNGDPVSNGSLINTMLEIRVYE